MLTKKYLMLNQDILGTKELFAESTQVVVKEEKVKMKSISNEEQEKDKSHPILIIGSNNVVGKNVFLINTGSDQETIQEALQIFPPEILDKFMFGLGTEIQKK